LVLERIRVSVNDLKAANKTDAINDKLKSMHEQINLLEAANKQQAEALAQAQKREQLLKEQKVRDEQYIKRMD